MGCEFSIKEVAEATGGQILSTVDKTFHDVGTDTRANLTGQIFVALKGDAHDAHLFLAKAVAAGAKCLLIHEVTAEVATLKEKVSIVLVPDTLKGLQDLGHYWRKKIKAKVVGITGSNGKTSTKEFAATILGRQFKVCASKGSFNNHWGVPLTLLQASKFDEVILAEMGMNHAGELTTLSHIAEPDIVVCTMVGRAHIGSFGSEEGIAKAKQEIYDANPKALQIFNYDNEHTIKMFEAASKVLGPDCCRVFSSFAAGAEVGMRATVMNLDSLQITGHIAGIKGEALVPVFGRHNVVNLMAAASIALAFGMEPELIWAALPYCQTVWGRNQLLKLPNGSKVLFDGYNANPDSMTSLMKNLFEINCTGKKIAVLGEMLELGDDAHKLHFELGEMIGNTDVELVWFYGPHAKSFEDGIRASSESKLVIISPDFDAKIAARIYETLDEKDIVVIKGSRGMKLERVMLAWDPQFNAKKQ